MLRLNILMLIPLLLLLACVEIVHAQGAPQARRKPAQHQDAFALVEFFTSEACVRCRASSELAAQVVGNAGGPLARVFLLSFHVDYLNSLSWKDPYSAEAYTKRQQEYMLKFRQGLSVPGSFVVNGTKYVETASAVSMQRAVLSALGQKPLASIELKAERTPDPHVAKISYTVDGLGKLRRPFFLIHIVAIQDKIQRTVADGVNQGQQFVHVNVVRNFQTNRLVIQDAAPLRGELDLVLPKDLSAENAQYIAFVQEPGSLRIIGAEGYTFAATQGGAK